MNLPPYYICCTSSDASHKPVTCGPPLDNRGLASSRLDKSSNSTTSMETPLLPAFGTSGPPPRTTRSPLHRDKLSRHTPLLSPPPPPPPPITEKVWGRGPDTPSSPPHYREVLGMRTRYPPPPRPITETVWGRGPDTPLLPALLQRFGDEDQIPPSSPPYYREGLGTRTRYPPPPRPITEVWG